MKSYFATILLVSAALLTGACGPVNAPSSRVKFAPADRNAYNVAFIVGSPNDLPGVGRDVREVSNMIKGANFGYNLEVLEHADVGEIMAKASEIGAKLSAKSTVFFYFSGHGSERGKLFAQGFETFQMSQVARQIGSGFGKGKFKRFIAVMDSCYSGQNVDGNESMFLGGEVTSQKRDQEILTNAVNSMASGMEPRSNSGLPFEQALIVGASKKSQTSDDLGSSFGGAFTYSWRRAMKRELGRKGATFAAVLAEAKDYTLKQTGESQTPVWKAMPETMLDETLDGEALSLPLNKDIFAALGGDITNTLVFASVPSSAQVAWIEMCQGEKVACSSGAANKIGSLLLAQDLKINGRSVFRSDKFIALSQIDLITLVLRKSDGSAIEARSISVKRR